MWALYLFICFVACGIAAWTDSTSGEISNKLTYPLIIIGFVLSLFPGMFLNIVYGLVFLLVSYLIYQKNFFGGGDIKLVLGLILINPTTNIMFIVLWLFIACIFSLTGYLYKYLIKKERGEKLNNMKFGLPMFIAMFILVVLYFLPHLMWVSQWFLP